MPIQYSPLDEGNCEIRLIRFLRTNKPQLEICIRTVPKVDSGPYYCLSYEWGDDTPVWPIIVDDTEILVPKNLGEALVRLQDERVVEYLWADALCINQEDMVEKRNQINLMGSIYSDATAVFAWLGPGSALTDEAMKEISHFGHTIIRHLMKIISPEMASDHLARPELTTQAFCMDIIALISQLDPECWEEIGWKNADGRVDVEVWATVLSRSFWKRAWILQELAKSSDAYILVGDKKAPLYCFSAILEFVHAISFVSADTATIYRMYDLMQLLFDTPILQKLRYFCLPALVFERDILSLIAECSDMSVTVPQDRIFSLSALTTTGLGPEINYSKALPELLEEITHDSFLRRGLHSPQLNTTKCPWAAGSPSWVAICSGTAGSFSLNHWMQFSRVAAVNGINDRHKFAQAADEFAACGQDSYTVTRNNFPRPGILRIPCIVLAQVDMFQRLGPTEEDIKQQTAILDHATNLGGASQGGNFKQQDLSQLLFSTSALTKLTAFFDTVTDLKPHLRARLRLFILRVLRKNNKKLSRSQERHDLLVEWIYSLFFFPKHQALQEAAEFYRKYKEEFSKALQIILLAGEQISNLSKDENFNWNILALCVAKSSAFLPTIKMACENRSIFKTSDGNVGLGPATLQAGDYLVILPNMRLPHIVRAAGPGVYQLIDEAFVPGIMYGEIFDKLEAPPETWMELC
jgi:hypothetical protein